MLKLRKIFSNPVLIIAFISLILIVIWFKNRLLMGSGEAGLPFYNLEWQWETIRWAWRTTSLGSVSGITIASSPTYWLLSRFEILGVPNFVTQATFFYISFLIGGISMYFFSKEIFHKIQSKYLLLATFFYWFNPISLVNVWRRFLYNHMVFFALLPLAGYLFLKGLRRRDYKFAVLFGLATTVFSYALSSFVFNIVLWGLILYISLFFLLTNKNERAFNIKYFGVSFLAYFGFNFWWIGQFIGFIFSSDINVSLNRFFSLTGNVSTLTALSDVLGKLINTTRLMHGTFFAVEQSWASFYQLLPLVILEFVVVGLIFLTIIKYRHIREMLFLGLLFIVGLFLVKGNSPPFGEIYQTIFTNISALQIFRNPFEKFGFLLPVAAAPIFAFGIDRLTNTIKHKKVKGFILFAGFLFVLVIWGYPFWTKLLFTGGVKEKGKMQSFEVEVPAYYREANDWFNKQKGEFTFISLPIGGEGITYNWNNVYSGVELSSILFEIPGISLSTSNPFFEGIGGIIDKAFIKNINFPGIMNALNARYILVRTDVDWRSRGMRNPESIEEILSARLDQFEKVNQFGQLSIWENKSWTNQKIYAENSVVRSLPYTLISDFSLLDKDSTTFYQGGQDVDNEVTFIRPTLKFYNENSPNLAFEIRQDIFPHVSYLPSHIYYNLVIFKENLEKKFVFNDEILAQMLTSLLGKRLHEVKVELDEGRIQGALISLNLYEKQLEEYREVVSRLNFLFLRTEGQAWKQEVLYDAFSRHKNLFLELEEKVQDDNTKRNLINTSNLLSTHLSSLGIFPEHELIDSELLPLVKRLTFRFVVEEDGFYDLSMEGKDWNNYFESGFDRPFAVQIDGEVKSVKGTLNEGGLVSFGEFHFDEGIHELGFNTPKQKNLINSSDEIRLETEHGTNTNEYEIKNYDPFGKYDIGIEYFLESGVSPGLFFEVNNDKIKEGMVIPSFMKTLPFDNYYYGIWNKSFIVRAPSGSEWAKLKVIVEPWNNCASIYWTKGRERCQDEVFRRPYDKKTTVVIHSASVKRRMFEDVYLKLDRKTEKSRLLPRTTYERVNPTRYKVKVKNADGPFYLIFSEVFNSNWKLIIEDGAEIPDANHFLANSYANGWRVNKTGDYEMTIEFVPQRTLDLGKKVSAFTIFGSLIYFGGKLWKRRKI